MGRQPHLLDTAFHRNGAAIDRQFPSFRFIKQVKKLPPGRLFVLIPCDYDTCILRRCQQLCILGAGASGQHTGTGYQDNRLVSRQQFFSLLCRSHRRNFLCVERLISLQNPLSQRIFQINRIPHIHPVDISDHAVYEHRHRRNLLVQKRHTQNQKDFLRPPQGKCRNQNFLLLCNAFPNQLHQTLLLHHPVCMQPISVGCLHNRHIRTELGNPDSFNSTLGKCGEITGIEQASFLRNQIYTRRPRNMPCRVERQVKSVKDRKRRLITDGMDTFQHGKHILF